MDVFANTNVQHPVDVFASGAAPRPTQPLGQSGGGGSTMWWLLGIGAAAAAGWYFFAGPGKELFGGGDDSYDERARKLRGEEPAWWVALYEHKQKLPKDVEGPYNTKAVAQDGARIARQEEDWALARPVYGTRDEAFDTKR